MGVITNWGRHSVACFRRTENPPWVLVSEAVKILQNECTVCLGGSGGHISGLLGSLCCNITITTNKFFLFEYLIHKSWLLLLGINWLPENSTKEKAKWMKNLSSFGNVFKWFFCLREPTRLPYRSFLQKLGKTKETKETKIWILGLLTFFLYMFSQQSIRAIINYLVNNTREQILTSNSGCKVICA